LTCNREQNSDIFYAAIGGFGMLGCFTAITLKLKRIYSGLLKVEATVTRNMGDTLQKIDDDAQRSDYVVGWGDAVASGKKIGRGQLHTAHYLPPETDPYPQQSLRAEKQVPPEFFFGIMPANVLWVGMRMFWNNAGISLRDTAKYWASWWGDGATYLQPHASFHFLLDYIPNWKRAFGPGGLIQYQPFIPADTAEQTFRDLLHLQQKRGLTNYLTVYKRHRPDSFLMTHGLDGFSMAMDFRITSRNRHDIVQLCREMDEIVLAAGGRFYFAKDSTLRPEVVHAYLGADTITQFRAIKQRCDPHNMLETNLWRRLFP
jgi:FAD/FMN-containing dehydrogenase